MAYVPGFKHDLFLSYAHDDGAVWIRALADSLVELVGRRLGDPIDIWRDKDDIRFGQKWTDEIKGGLEECAALLAIVSPSYRSSEWCGRERRIFLDHCKAQKALQAGSFYRFLKLIKTPWEDDGHEQFHPELEHIDFFERSRKGNPIADIVEFGPGTTEFLARVATAAGTIAALLQNMRRSREPVFIAGTAPDCDKERTSVLAELRARGYNAYPTGQIDEGFTPEYIQQEMRDALLSVHILGGVHDDVAEDQIRLAADLGKSLVFWITRAAESSGDLKQKALVEDIRGGKFSGCEWLNSRSSLAFAEHLVEKLKRRPAAETSSAGTRRIYLLCDPTTAEDVAFARELQGKIRQEEGMAVDLPPTDASPTSRSDAHNQLLRDSHGLLLYRKTAPASWLYRTAEHVIYAEAITRREEPAGSKGFLLADISALPDSPVPLYAASPQFTLNDIEPFLKELRGARAA